jgi:RecB family exonuclease
VVLPGGRAGRRLEELLVEEAGHRGLRLVPPRIVGVARAQEEIADVDGILSTPVEDQVAWTRALTSVARQDLERVFPTAPVDTEGPQLMELARLCVRLHRTVGAEGLTFRDVSHRCPRVEGFDDSERWKSLSAIQHEAIALLRKAGRLDRESALDAAAHQGAVRDVDTVWLIGLTELSRTARRLLSALPAGSIRILVAAPEDRAAWFDAWGCPREETWIGADLSLSDDRIRVVDRPRDQGRVVAQILGAVGQDFSADEIVIATPDPTLVPFIEHEVRAAGVPTRYAGGRSLRRTAPFLLLESIATYLEAGTFSALATLMRHPAFQAGFEDERVFREAPDILDRYHERHLQARIADRVHGNSREARLVRELVGRLGEEDLLGPLSGRRPVSEWAGTLMSLLVRVYGRTDVDPETRRGRDLLACLEALKRPAAALVGLPPALVASASAPAAIRLLLFLCRDDNIPPDPSDEAVELLGWLENPLDDSPGLVICGVNEPSLPESVGGDPFLPNGLRQHLGLPSDDTRFARDLFHLESMLHSRREVWVVAGRRGAEGDPLQPSRLLFATQPAAAAARILRILGERGEGLGPEAEPAPHHSDGGGTPSQVATASVQAFASPPEANLRFDPPEVLSVTDFRSILMDPYRWVLERRMGLRPRHDGDRELTPPAFGSLVHKVLERFGRDSEATAMEDADRLEQVLSGILDRIVAEEFGDTARPAVAIQIEHLRIRLRGFAQWQAGWRRQGWRITGTEMHPAGGDPGVPLSVDGESVLLSGRIDRVDHNDRTGEWAVFDYKTSDTSRSPEQVHRRGREKRWVDLQLPLYRHLLPFLIGPDGGPLMTVPDAHQAEMGYILLPRDPGSAGAAWATGRGPAPWTAEDFAAADQVAAQVIRFVRGGEVSFDPTSVRSYLGQPLAPLVGALELFGADEADPGRDDGE